MIELDMRGLCAMIYVLGAVVTYGVCIVWSIVHGNTDILGFGLPMSGIWPVTLVGAVIIVTVESIQSHNPKKDNSCRW